MDGIPRVRPSSGVKPTRVRTRRSMATNDDALDKGCDTCQQLAKRPRIEDGRGVIFDYIHHRQTVPIYGNPLNRFTFEIASRMPQVLQEKEYSLGRMNKIFASKWINDKQIVFGTKCNQLIVLDVETGRRVQIPSLLSSDQSTPAPSPCGIHSISISPSHSLLATGASNTNDVAVYKLPTFDPVCVGELGHADWIFDLLWIDDEYLVSGSRDGILALWKMDNTDDGKPSRRSSLFIPDYAIKQPRERKHCSSADKVRALAHDRSRNHVAAISLNGYCHLWDMNHFSQIWSKPMSGKEHVCLSYNEDRQVYAIGSQSYVHLLDVRMPSKQPLNENSVLSFSPIDSAYKEKGVRSVGFNDDIITIGTGAGALFFYSMRAKKYVSCGLEGSHSHSDDMCLEMGKGWLRCDETYRDFFSTYGYPNAVYTHSYDSSNTRLFAAGGPLPSGLWGNYAGLWH